MDKEFMTGEFVPGAAGSTKQAGEEPGFDIMSAADNAPETASHSAPIPENPGNTANNNETANGDEYVIGGGFEITQTPDEPNRKSQKKRRKKPRGVFRTVFWVVLILAVSAGIAVGAIFCVIDYMGLGASNSVTVTITKGESLDSIADQLQNVGAIRFKFLFKLYAEKKGYYNEFKEGIHTFKTDYGYANIVNEFVHVPGQTAKTTTVTIPELATVDSIAELLADKGVCSKEDFYDVVQNSTFNYDFLKDIPLKSVHYRLEGYLYPDTYEFYVWNSKEGAEAAVTKMLDNFNSKYTKELREQGEKLGYTTHEILTMASIVEMECNGYYDEMPKVAAVFYNRLKYWGDEPKKLGSSPTANSPYGSGNYDTNKIEGLPPGPMCSTGIEAIKAATNPDESMKKKYFYFVTDTDFKYYYNESLAQHNATIESLRMKGKWGED